MAERPIRPGLQRVDLSAAGGVSHYDAAWPTEDGNGSGLLTEDQPWLGMTVGSLKVTDLRRDAQLLESSDPPQDNPSVWPSEAKLAGRAIWFASPKRPTSRRTFRVDATEAALTRVGELADHLAIDSWHQGRGFERRNRQ